MLFRTKASVLSLFLMISIISLMNCSTTEPVLVAENVYRESDFDFASRKKIAFFLDRSKVPPGYQLPELTEVTEEEFKNRGYSVVSNKDFVTFYNTSKMRTFDLYHPELLSEAKEKLGVDAIVQQTIVRFDVGEKELDHSHMVTAGGSRGFSLFSQPRTVWIFDVGMTFEMISVEKGNRVWACSISLERYKFDREPYRLIKEIIAKCLNTIPRS